MMPKWLSSILILIGFLALIVLAVLPRNIEVTVTTNVDDRDVSTTVGGDHSLHQPPESENEPEENGGE